MNYIKRVLVLISTLLFLLCSLPSTVFAQTDALQKTVRVGYFTMENFMEGGADGLPQSGFTYELLCEIATYNHWNVEFVYGEFGDLLKQLEEGTIDILPNVIRTEERQSRFLFHDLCLNEEHYYISAIGSEVNLDSWDISMLNGKRLAVVKDAYEGVLFDKWADEHDISMEKVYCEGFDEAWDLLELSEADYILNINNIAPGPRFTSLCEIGESGVYFAIARGRSDILSDIDFSLDMIDSVSPFLLSDLQQEFLNEALSSYQLSAGEKAWIEQHAVLRDSVK